MGVYIPNMNMPTSCEKCPFTCEALQFFNGKGRPQSCPLIEIPTPHGRLIDGDKLIREEIIPFLYHLKNGDIAVPKIDIINAPTILEAEE